MKQVTHDIGQLVGRNMQQGGTGPDSIERLDMPEGLESAMMNRQACQHAGSLDHFDAGVHCDHMKAVLEKMETISSGATTCIQDQSAGLEQGLVAHHGHQRK